MLCDLKMIARRWLGGFALHEAFWRRVAGVSDPRVVQFPPTGDGADAVCGGVAATVRTHWVKIVK